MTQKAYLESPNELNCLAEKRLASKYSSRVKRSCVRVGRFVPDDISLSAKDHKVVVEVWQKVTSKCQAFL